MDEEWVVQTQKKISSAFQLFDKEKKGTIVQEEVPTIMRYLGAYPTEKAFVQDILPEMQEDEPAAFVKYARLEEVMLKILASKEWEPDSEDVLLQAFRTIDTEGKGYIAWDTMRELLQSKVSVSVERREERKTGISVKININISPHTHPCNHPQGTPFRDKECEQFQAIARDMESGCVYYEDYVALLAADLND